MSKVTIICNIIFVIVSTILMFNPSKRILQYKSKTIADYVIAIIYIFNCLPVLFDLVVGVPQYQVWYSAFQTPLTDEATCLIYNVYITIVLAFINNYSRRQYLNNSKRLPTYCNSEILVLSRWRTPIIDSVFIIIPFIYVFFKCEFTIFTGYETLSQRGVASNVVSIINQLFMVGLFFCITRYFSKNRGWLPTLGLAVYTLLVIWINGKRYIIITIILMIFYLYQIKKSKEKRRVNLMIAVPFIFISFVIFSGYYILNVKITSNIDTVYSSLRIDFGRDDVTKFVINKVLLNDEKILEYPGQTFLSSIFMFVPRSFWPTKPYPHYRYLTAAIFDTSIYNIPSGMTPSIFEMSICNFEWLGFFATILVLILLCRFADRSSRLENRLLLLVIITNVLTQSLDAALSLLVVLLINLVFGKVKFSIGNSKRVNDHE